MKRRTVRILWGVMALPLLAGACRSTPVRSATDRDEDARIFSARQRTITDSVRAVLARGLADSAYPAAYAVVGTSRGVYASMGVGALEPMPLPARNTANDSAYGASNGSRANTPYMIASQPVSDSTVWDLASLTKVIATTSAVLQLVADRRVLLDAPVSLYLPRWTAAGAGSVTVRQLLTHSAGLPAWRPLYKEAWSAEEAMAQIYATSPDTSPGVRYVYSDIGFILLGELVAGMSGLPLDSYVLANVFLPLGMRETRFLPSAMWQSRTASTEIDPWRQRQLRGEVHDENSFQLGAVAGHAGLFSTARDLTRFAQALLLSGWGDALFDAPRLMVRGSGLAVFEDTTLRAFVQRQSVVAGSHRALGWETPTGTNSAGRRLSSSAFGHTGFTGTSLWIDPAQDLFVLLLTNRVNPTRQRQGIARVRSGLAEAVVSAIETAESSRPGPARTRSGNLE